MKTTKVHTRFMDGNKTTEVFDILSEHYGMNVVCNHKIDYEAAIFSNGFINAIEDGLIPILGSEHESFKQKQDKEYHHFILNDECYVVYFS